MGKKAEIARLVIAELEKEGVDLDLPDVDPEALKAAVSRVQRSGRAGSRAVAVRLIPIKKP